MGFSHEYIIRRSQIHDDLRRAVAEPIEPADDDPQYRCDQAIRSIELGFYALWELGPHLVDWQKVATLSGDMRELAMRAFETQRFLRRQG